MTAVSGVGPWPGTDALEAATTVVGDLADTPSEVEGLPFAPLLPARGPWGDATGAAVALLTDMPAELGPHGWKLADRPGRDLERARALAREDLDALAVAAHGYVGGFVLPVLGPFTFAADVYLARGDKLLSDHGAVRDVVAASAEGVAARVADLRRVVPGADVRVLLREPLLAPVLAGAVPGFSGRAPLRRVPGPVVAEGLGAVADAARGAGATALVVHGGTAWSALAAVGASSADGAALAVAGIGERGWEEVARVVEGGTALWAELPPQASSQCAGPDVVGQADVLLRPWRSVGMPAGGLRDVVLLAGAPPERAIPDDARGALAGLVRAAGVVAERAES
ncbi:conserved hypothetical protein [Cellulomonas flavigena DSM 20109]|uniref:Methionine synthase vitamin-B12 independent n=1 Tax=Cellulomonas flavigena (strain ATCC 482 / DSM 20109 / BCRC 11376 / JCM 18109 / NBRC 3775 / NCIMB 8073 / NRS 134) TaxID=446466 RepID=D5ULG9_CELFN|nr:hypothetical protein [Cellulomonas flavigena]ADG74011.1 conserved hypothetical protein [Cellulomonas flavigena DSM 20109]